ncbi:MAG: hypothetical protein AAGA84_11075 [Pseudomonadota bacterium]
MSPTELQALRQKFESLRIPPEDFHHLKHVYVAFAMLDQYDFVSACAKYAQTIRAMAEGVGVPEKFNATITFAFMSVIAERKAQMPDADLESFLKCNADLMSAGVLSEWYSNERLTCASARTQFLLPDRVGIERR